MTYSKGAKSLAVCISTYNVSIAGQLGWQFQNSTFRPNITKLQLFRLPKTDLSKLKIVIIIERIFHLHFYTEVDARHCTSCRKLQKTVHNCLGTTEGNILETACCREKGGSWVGYCCPSAGYCCPSVGYCCPSAGYCCPSAVVCRPPAQHLRESSAVVTLLLQTFAAWHCVSSVTLCQ